MPQLVINNIYNRLIDEGIDIEPFRARMDVQGSASVNCADFRENRVGVGGAK